MRGYEKSGKVCGSALVWVVSVLAILIIFLLCAVTASTVYATRVSKQSINSQMKYTARSAVDVFISKYCGDTVYSSVSPSPLITEIGVGATAGPMEVKFNSPEPMNPMGKCEVGIKNEDNETFTITATASYEDIAEESVSAEIKKQSFFDAGLICPGSITFGEGAALDFGDDTAIVLDGTTINLSAAGGGNSGNNGNHGNGNNGNGNGNNGNGNGNNGNGNGNNGQPTGPVVSQVFNSGSNNKVYTSIDTGYFGTDTPFSAAPSAIDVSFDMPSGEYKKVANKNSFTDEITKYSFDGDYTGVIELSGKKTYYFNAESADTVTLDFLASSTEYSVVYIDAGSKNVKFNLKSIPETVILYINGENASLSIPNSVGTINGALYVGSISIGENAVPKLNYIRPGNTVCISSPNIDSYIFKFARYKQGVK